MARQIEYDPVALRKNILGVFWQHGFSETSLADIEAATGLNRRQLYNGPGDKREMFLQALDDFFEQVGRDFLGKLESDEAGIQDIANLLNRLVGLADGKEGVSGCLVCSTSQEEIAQDSAVKDRLDAYFDRIKSAYVNTLTRAIARGEIDLPGDAVEGRSASLFAVHVALCILGRAKRPQEELARMAAQAVADLR
ncbi:TetR/AcrR family transcriptional regulator [Roseovarius sp. 2305UL8-3]|uniref:TetR/AcrR family transcriptional regulator n=1 Tax=Roseovarius conchicola TaxID=3121636 RepID=UPI003527AB21